MSYILDALRRAEAERERGSVPTLHSRQAAAVPADLSDAAAASSSAVPHARPWLWGAAGLALAAAAWYGLGREAAPVPAPAPLPPAMPQSQAQVLPPAPAPAPSAPIPSTPTPSPELRRLQPPPPPATLLPAEPAVAPPARAETKQPPPPLAALPEETRRQLPTLLASGAMYSDTPANRMLIINGQLLREGDKLTPDLLLEQIQLKSAVLVFKGQQRFSISY